MSDAAATVRAEATIFSAAGRLGAVLTWIERRSGLTPSGTAVAATAVLGWGLARIIGSRAAFLLAYGAAAVLVAALLLAQRRPRINAGRTSLPSRLREGQKIEVAFEVEAARRLTTLIVEETLHPAMGESVRVGVPVLPAGERLQHTYTLRPRLRGVYAVGPLVAVTSDPFGLTRRRLVIGEPVEVIVHPSTELVHDRVLSRAWEDPPIRPPTSKPWPTGFEFYGMRDYVPGDDPRRIIWRATARTIDPVTGQGRYLVREAEQGITDRVMIVLDTDVRTHSPGRVSETFEAAVRTAASLGVRHITDGFAVTIETNGGRIADALRTRRSQIRLLDSLARVGPERAALADVIQRVVMHGRRDTHLVIVTPHVDEEAAARIGLLRRRGASILVAAVLWGESDPASLHRVGALGCNVVEVTPQTPLQSVFQRVVEAGARRQ